MAATKGMELATIVKSRHHELRRAVEASKPDGGGGGGAAFDAAATAKAAGVAEDRIVWDQHLQDDAGLAKYAEAMHQLATQEWTAAGT